MRGDVAAGNCRRYSLWRRRVASVVCNYNCRQANLHDLPASKPTLAGMISRRQGYHTLSRRVSIGGRWSVTKATSVGMVQPMIRPSRSIVLPPVPATHWFSCFAFSVQPHTFWKEGCGLVRRGRDCQTLSLIIHTRTSPMISARFHADAPRR